MAYKRWIHGSMAVLLVGALTAGCAREMTPAPPPISNAPSLTPQITVMASPGRATPAPATSEAASKEPAPKPAGSPYFQGKTIEMIVSSSAGGGTDLAARIVATFLPKYVPGNPKVLIRNQPGGSGTTANNLFVDKLKPDGLKWIVNASAQFTTARTRPDIAHYDPTTYEYLCNISRAPSLIIIRKDALNRLTDRSAKPVYVGTREGNPSWAAMPIWAQEYLNWNLKWILGFPGANDIEMAIYRGEIDMIGTASAPTIQEMMKQGLVVPLTQESMMVDGKGVRRPDFPDVPTFEELLGAKKPSGLSWQAYQAWSGTGQVDKSIAAQPGTPANIMGILTDAFRSMSKDREFDETIKKMVSPVYSMGIGQETVRIAKEVGQAPMEALDYGTSLQVKFGLILPK